MTVITTLAFGAPVLSAQEGSPRPTPPATAPGSTVTLTELAALAEENGLRAPRIFARVLGISDLTELLLLDTSTLSSRQARAILALRTIVARALGVVLRISR